MPTPVEIAALFAPLQAVIARANTEGGVDKKHPWYHQLIVHVADGLLDVQYHGEAELSLEGEDTTALDDLLFILAGPAVAPCLRSFTFHTPGVWASNGMADFNIDSLVEGGPLPHLERMLLPQGQGEHGYLILNSPSADEHFGEGGVLARLLDKAPRLRELKTPNPPDEAFFQEPPHPLRTLDVDAGLDHAGFIRRLAGCTRFPELRHLTFTDFRQSYMGDWRTSTTPFGDFVALLWSEVGRRLESIRLREVVLTPDEVSELLAIRSEGVEITRSEQTG